MLASTAWFLTTWAGSAPGSLLASAACAAVRPDESRHAEDATCWPGLRAARLLTSQEDV